VDGNWQVDDDNALRENDGLGNMNSVYFKTNVIFQLKNHQNARKVYVAGSFNNWKPKDLEMIRTSDGWELPMYLADGTHTYRFIVDGKWMIDPDNKDQVPNEFNETNSVLRIGIPVLFTINGNLQLPEVLLSGSFNNWRRNELFMKKTADGWELPYNLGPGNYEYRFASKGKWISDPQPPLIIKPNYTFRLKGFPDAKTVYLAGDFNNWSSNGYQMKREGDDWVFTVHLSEGKHQYKFVVDNNWIRDPNNPLWEQNDSGNSIVWFGR
jgi:1,4-alpha-glucan branching enzyme